MWWQQKPNGKWQFFERYTDEVTGLTPTVSVTMDKNTAVTRKAAQTALAAKIEAKHQKVGEYASMTLKELLELYLKRDGIRESTRLRDTALSNVLKQILDEDALINRMNAGYIKQHMADAGKADNRELIARIKALIRWAYQNDYVNDIAYLDKLKKPKKADKDLKAKYMEADELKTLLNGMKIREWRDLTEFLVL